jgi:putative colanic acid biosynthesis UDP-glucose lipid carrier transferase
VSFASFTNSPGYTKVPAQSVAGGRAVPATVGKSRPIALLVLAADTEFLLVTVAAYSAAVLYHWLILQDLILHDAPDAEKYIQESLLISALQLLVSVGLRQYSRIQTQPRHVFLWSGASAVFFAFSIFISMIFLLKISDGYSRATVIAQAAGVHLTVLCTRALSFSLLQPAIASGLIDARRIILIGDPTHCLHFSARAAATGIRTTRTFDFPTFCADPPAPGRPGAIQALSSPERSIGMLVNATTSAASLLVSCRALELGIRRVSCSFDGRLRSAISSVGAKNAAYSQT